MDNVVRKIAFEKDHPGVTFEVERTFFLNHRATWTNPATGESCSVSSLSLGFLLDELEAGFSSDGQSQQRRTEKAQKLGSGDDGRTPECSDAHKGQPAQKAGGSSVTAS